MKPRHVYLSHYVVSGNRVKVNVEDLGENPDFKLISLYFSPIEFLEKYPGGITYWPIEF